MQTIKETLFTGWHFMRWLRLIFGILFIIQAVQMHDIMVGIIAGFFLLTAIVNVGCCGTQSCAAPMKKETNDIMEEISYEEIKN